jgi:hypothetical protein
VGGSTKRQCDRALEPPEREPVAIVVSLGLLLTGGRQQGGRRRVDPRALKVKFTGLTQNLQVDPAV